MRASRTRLSIILTLTASLTASLTGCTEANTPIQVLQNYTANVESADDIRAIRYSEFLTQRAQESVAKGLKKISPVLVDFDFSLSINDEPGDIKDKQVEVTTNPNPENTERMFRFVLATMKDGSTLCSSAEYVSVIEGSTATLTCELTDYTDEQGTLYKQATRTVDLANEDGWKIDKISVEFVSESGSFSTATFN